MKLAVVGPSGSGKTTLARELASSLGVPHVELDALLWGPGWTKTSPEQFDARVEEATRAERWVIRARVLRVRRPEDLALAFAVVPDVLQKPRSAQSDDE